MHIGYRLFVVLWGAGIFYVVVHGFATWDTMSAGQGWLLLSGVPFALGLCAIAAYSKIFEDAVMTVIMVCCGLFVIMVSVGTWLETGKILHTLYSFAGIFLIVISVQFIVRKIQKKSSQQPT